MFPVIEEPHQKPLIHRMLRLSCLTHHYAKLWQELADSEILNERWTSDDPRLCSHAVNWKDLNSNRWDRSFSLRTNFARRQALLEIDVLCAMALKITLEELLVVYRVQFSVLQQYESNDLYDNYGRRIPSTTRKNPGGKQFSEAFREWQAEGNNPLDPKAPPLTVSWEIDNGLQTITKTFYPPFTKVDREADYARAYEVFQQRYGGQR
jgi:hypothetical protein